MSSSLPQTTSASKVYRVEKFISVFPDLIYKNSLVWCLVCNKDLVCWKRSQCQKHVDSATHKYKKSCQTPYTDFIFDLIFMLCACNIPFYTIQKKTFREFWEVYNPDWKLPSESTLRNYLPRVRDRMENTIRNVVNNKHLWLTVDESIDSKKNSVANVIVRPLNPYESSPPYLLASKRLKQCTGESITNLVLIVLKKFNISANQILMFVTDGGSCMLQVGHFLRHVCPNLLHVTCLLHALHLVVEIIRSCYPDVDALISYTKSMFQKSPKRIRQFHEMCPNIPEPPQFSLTRWGAWLEAAFYYHQHFQQIRTLLLQFNPNESAAIKASQLKFNDSQVEIELQTIFTHYHAIANAITILQKSSLSLVESLQIIDKIQIALEALCDEKGVRVRETFNSILRKNTDLTRLRQIYRDDVSLDPFSCFRDSFNYANITSLVEQSFSLHKNILSPLRTRFKETTVETYAMLQMYSQTHADL